MTRITVRKGKVITPKRYRIRRAYQLRRAKTFLPNIDNESWVKYLAWIDSFLEERDVDPVRPKHDVA